MHRPITILIKIARHQPFQEKTVSLQYISAQFRVPAVRGSKVSTKELKPRSGTIIGARGSLLRVRIDGQDDSILLHPRRDVHYAAPETGKSLSA